MMMEYLVDELQEGRERERWENIRGKDTVPVISLEGAIGVLL